jgi:hypothetical protein
MHPLYLVTLALFPDAPFMEGVARIQAVELLMKASNLECTHIHPPVKGLGGAVVALDCCTAGRKNQAFRVNVFTDRVDESNIFCMSNHGIPLALMRLKVEMASNGVGHSLTMQTKYYRETQRLRNAIHSIAESLGQNAPTWDPAFRQHPDLKKYRDIVFEDT